MIGVTKEEMFGGLCIISGVLQLAYLSVFLSYFPFIWPSFCSWVLVSGVKENKTYLFLALPYPDPITAPLNLFLV